MLRDFVSADFIAGLDFSTLERCSGSYVTDDLRECRLEKGGLVLCGVASGISRAHPTTGWP